MPETLHSPQQVKVFILYLLDKIGYPIDYNDVVNIVIRDGYVDYFDFVTHFHELLEGGHIKKITPDEYVEKYGKPETERPANDLYTVSETGRLVANGLADDLILAAVREKSYISAMRHLSLEKREAVIKHDIEQLGDGTYIFHCSIKDKFGLAFDLDIRADSFMQASRMRMNFEDRPDVVYRGITALVTGNVNYLFDK